MFGAVPAEIAHIGVHVRKRYRADQCKVNVVNGNVIEFRSARSPAFFQFDETKKVAQIQIVFIDRFAGVTLDRLMVNQKIP